MVCHQAEAGRVVNVSSSLHKVPSVLSVVDDPLFAKGYSLFPAYAQVRPTHQDRQQVAVAV